MEGIRVEIHFYLRRRSRIEFKENKSGSASFQNKIYMRCG